MSSAGDDSGQCAYCAVNWRKLLLLAVVHDGEGQSKGAKQMQEQMKK